METTPCIAAKRPSALAPLLIVLVCFACVFTLRTCAASVDRGIAASQQEETRRSIESFSAAREENIRRKFGQ